MTADAGVEPQPEPEHPPARRIPAPNPPVAGAVVARPRWPPALQLARLRAAGDLAVIDGADLAWTVDEAAAYFSMCRGRQALSTGSLSWPAIFKRKL